MNLLSKRLRVFLTILFIGIFLIETQAIDLSVLIKIIRTGTYTEKQKAEAELFAYLQKKHFPESYEGSFKHWLFLKKIYGSLEDECIAAFRLGAGRISIISVFSKGESGYFESESLQRSRIEDIGFEHLTDGDALELITNEFMWYTGLHSLQRFIFKYDGKAMKRIWWGVLEESRLNDPTEEGKIEKAQVFYRDLDNDGIKEIIRAGTDGKYKYNEKTRKLDIFISQKAFREIYKWNPKEFRYELSSEQ